jgi:heavy metal sensor kinase
MILAPRSIRGSLTLWYTLILSIIIVIYSFGLFIFFQNYLLGDLDRSLRADIEDIEDHISETLKSQKIQFTQVDPNRLYFEVWDDSGQRVLTSEQNNSLQAPDQTCGIAKGKYETFRVSDGLILRMACKTVNLDGKKWILRSSRSQERIQHEIDEMLFYMIIGSLSVVVICAAGGYWLARRTLSPVAELTAQARLISAEKLNSRLSIKNPNDELGQLATTFNGTFERLEKSFEQMKRFTADASHELRTPLTALRTVGEVALRENHNTSQYRDVISSMLEEADSLRELIETLLTLSRADSGQLILNKVEYNLSIQVKETCLHLQVLAEEKGQTLNFENTGSDIFVLADQGLLRQALINLIDNAIKYSPVKSQVLVSIQQTPQSVSISVHDEGPGIPPEHQERIFDRFYRVDPARSREQSGIGIGLSLAKFIVEASGGKLQLMSTVGKGSLFTILLPKS